jgi:hypothetical protein
MLKAVPAVCGLLTVLKTKLAKAPALTVNELLVPDMLLPVVEIVIPVPDLVSVTEPVQTPAVNALVLVGLMVPEDTVRVFVPV